MTLEQLEFAITQYLDGTLPAEETGALEQTLATDPQARALMDEHRRLTDLLRSGPAPDLDWSDLARDLSAVVTGSVDERSRAADQKLNAILKAATPLPAIRWEALSRHIAGAVDAEVASTDAGDDRFDELLRAASPAPALNWDRLASHLSSAVAAEADREREQQEQGEDAAPAVIGRIGFGWLRTVGSLAVAACVLVATGLGLRTYLGGGGTHPTGNDTHIAVGPAAHSQPQTMVMKIDTPAPERVNQPAVAEISVGPSKAYADSGDDAYRRTVANRSPVVIVTPAHRERPQQEDPDQWLAFD